MGYVGDAKREYQREWMQRRRDAWIAENGPCQHCGSDEDLEVDHVDPLTKELPPSRLWSLSLAKREKELAKCQVLCRPCHIEKSRTEHPYGENAPGTKLSDEDLEEIRELHRSGQSTRMLANRFEVHIRTVQSIVYGRDDRHWPRYNKLP